MIARTGNRDGRMVDSGRRRARRVALAACRISPTSELLLSVLLVAALAGGAVVFLPKGTSLPLPDATLPPVPQTLRSRPAPHTTPLIFEGLESDPTLKLSAAPRHRGHLSGDMLTSDGRADGHAANIADAAYASSGSEDIRRETGQGESTSAGVGGVATGHMAPGEDSDGDGGGDGGEHLAATIEALWSGFASQDGGLSAAPLLRSQVCH